MPEPRPLDPDAPQTAELAVDIESRHHLTWAAQQATSYVLAENDWRTSIASQGVMEAVWLVAATYQHADGSTPVTTFTSVEGSSRVTADHYLLDIRSADVAYDDNEAKLRAHIRKLNEAFDRGPITRRSSFSPPADSCSILVGFHAHAGATPPSRRR